MGQGGLDGSTDTMLGTARSCCKIQMDRACPGTPEVESWNGATLKLKWKPESVNVSGQIKYEVLLKHGEGDSSTQFSEKCEIVINVNLHASYIIAIRRHGENGPGLYGKHMVLPRETISATPPANLKQNKQECVDKNTHTNTVNESAELENSTDLILKQGTVGFVDKHTETHDVIESAKQENSTESMYRSLLLSKCKQLTQNTFRLPALGKPRDNTYVYGETETNFQSKTVLFLGNSAVGKSSLINAIVSHMFQVESEDNFRLNIIRDGTPDPETHDMPETDVINIYIVHPYDRCRLGFTFKFVDTPGLSAETDDTQYDDIFATLKNKNVIPDLVCIVDKTAEKEEDSTSKNKIERLKPFLGDFVADSVVLALTHRSLMREIYNTDTGVRRLFFNNFPHHNLNVEEEKRYWAMNGDNLTDMIKIICRSPDCGKIYEFQKEMHATFKEIYGCHISDTQGFGFGCGDSAFKEEEIQTLVGETLSCTKKYFGSIIDIKSKVIEWLMQHMDTLTEDSSYAEKFKSRIMNVLDNCETCKMDVA